MRVVLFCHSLLADWDQPDAHFLRGIAGELMARRHEVRVYEPRNASSVESLVRARGEAALSLSREAYPRIRPRRYDLATLDLDDALDSADIVLVHENVDAELIRGVGARRKRPGARFKALFHDTHRLERTQPGDLAGFDGVLASSTFSRDAYRDRSDVARAWTWHVAADPRVFFPLPPRPSGKDTDVIYIGNWKGEERATRLRELFARPVRDLSLTARSYGVGYPPDFVRELGEHGVVHGGYLPNHLVPQILAQARIAVHLGERPHGIGIFEALACATPVVCGPTEGAEELFTPGRDFLVARDGEEMRRHLQMLVNDAAARSELARHGRSTILAHHTCAHRVDELVAIAAELGVRVRRAHPVEVSVAR